MSTRPSRRPGASDLSPVQALVDDLELNTTRNKGGGREGLVAGGNSGAAFAIVLAAGNVITVTMTGNCTFTLPTPANDGAYAFTLILIQDGTGTRTATWPASVKWPAGTAPTLTTTANKRDVLTFLTIDGGATWIAGTAGLDYV